MPATIPYKRLELPRREGMLVSRRFILAAGRLNFQWCVASPAKPSTVADLGDAQGVRRSAINLACHGLAAPA